MAEPFDRRRVLRALVTQNERVKRLGGILARIEFRVMRLREDGKQPTDWKLQQMTFFRGELRKAERKAFELREQLRERGRR